MMETKNNFAVGSIPHHIMSIAGPMIVAQLINVLYNIIDRIYIGRIPHVAHACYGRTWYLFTDYFNSDGIC